MLQLEADEFTAAFKKIKKTITYRGQEFIYLHIYPEDYSAYWVHQVKPVEFIRILELQHGEINSRAARSRQYQKTGESFWTISHKGGCVERRSNSSFFETLKELCTEIKIERDEIYFLRVDTPYLGGWADFRIDSVHSSFKETLAGITSFYNLHREISRFFKGTSGHFIEADILSDILKKELNDFKEI